MRVPSVLEREGETLVHMVLADAWKKYDKPNGYVPKYVTLSLDKAKEVFKKAKEALINTGGCTITLDVPAYFEGNDGEWNYHYKLYSMPLDKLIMISDYDN